MLRKENEYESFINVDIKDVHELIKQNLKIAVFHEKILIEQTKIYLDLFTLDTIYSSLQMEILIKI
jgi:hypothetical protein